MSNLNPDQFFHGTTHAIKDGMVRPADEADKGVSEHSFGDPGDMSEGNHAFVSEDEGHAWRIANTIHPSMRRSRVYTTGDNPDKKPGPWNPRHPDWLEHVELDHPDPKYAPSADDIHEQIVHGSLPEWGSKTGFPVTGRIDTMPGHQGTFPDVSWGRFSSRPYDQSVNHPSDRQVRYGTDVRGTSFRDALDHIHEKALVENAARTPEPRRTGARLRAFMKGDPDPGPLADHPKLF